MKTFCRNYVQIQFFNTLYMYFKSRWEGEEWWGCISHTHLIEKNSLCCWLGHFFPWLSRLKLLLRLLQFCWFVVFFFPDIVGKYCMWDIQQKFSCRGGRRGGRAYQQKWRWAKEMQTKVKTILQRLDQELALSSALEPSSMLLWRKVFKSLHLLIVISGQLGGGDIGIS